MNITVEVVASTFRQTNSSGTTHYRVRSFPTFLGFSWAPKSFTH